MKRSVSTELTLDAGTYWVLMKITAKRFPDVETVEDVVAKTCQSRREKLLQVGLSYDLAHAKGNFRELLAEREEAKKQARRARRKHMSKLMYAARTKEHKKQKLRHMRMDAKKHQKAMKAVVREAEARAQEEAREAAAKLEELKLADDVNWNGDRPQPPRRSTLNGHQRSASPGPMRSPGFAPGPPRRRDTLTVEPPRHGSISMMTAPPIRVQRASLNSAGDIALSDVSDDDISWDSELDGPEDSADESMEPGASGPGYFGEDKMDSESEDDFEKDPWNAVCVVGLRVYAENQEAEIEIVRGEKTEETNQNHLDVDDASKDAVDAVRTPLNSPISPNVRRGMGSLERVLMESVAF